MTRRRRSIIGRLAAAAAACLMTLVTAMPAAVSQPRKPDEGYATPPPLPPGTPVPVDSGKPDLAYEQKTTCVRSLNEGVVLPNKPWGQTQLRFDELHRFATGKGQRVAVIDTGVNRHDFLGNRLSGGGDYVADKGQPGLEDCDGHGTEVAGIIAAKPPEGSDIGFRGIAPDASIVSIRQSSAAYEGKDTDPDAQTRTAGNLLTLAQAIVRAANAVPHGVINMSVDNCRTAGPITAAEVAVQSALRFALEDRDVVVVASAGNLKENDCNQQNGPDASRPTTIVTPPWFAEYVISVAAIDRNGDPAQFSVQGPWVTVGAPGTEITSLDPGNNQGLANRLLTKEGPAEIQGTSFAAPYVAGTAALVRERYPNLTARQVMERIKASSSHPAAPGGRDNLVGHGMINPIAALTAMIPSEQGIAPDKSTDITFQMPTQAAKDWTPVTVAMLGALGGVGALLLTLFVVHTVRRNRREPDALARVRA